MSSITLVLPYPVSSNRYWRTFMPKGFKAPVTTLSSEAKAYKEQVRLLVLVAGIRKPIKGRVAVSYVLYPNRPLDWQKRMRADGAAWDDTVMCIDLDNAQKVLFDSLKNLAFEDDKWVRRIHAERAEPDGDARVVVTITAIATEQPQAALFDALPA